MNIPLGIRNNNPLNIRRGKTPWKGEELFLKATGGAFCKFESVEWGLRAAFCLLRTYRDKYHVVCVADIVRRWAPPSENNTVRYIQNICRWTGFGGQQRLTEKDWPALVRAMARQECGMRLTDEQLEKAFELYRRK